ncbi:unnamed protein product [Phytomonas sp. Hart1]|nr:unnamed protein product [Phytomonas sp. Hart1]|eukprot:CCW66062.1 unnamed protein product [Phytomonas sp. isolate Hart1]
MLMRCVIFLGLDKLRLPRPQWHSIGHRSPASSGAKFGKPPPDDDAFSSTLNIDFSAQSASEAASVLLVATTRGCLVLRGLAACVLAFFFHILFGIRYFVLVHVFLFGSFAFFVLFLPQRVFIEQMGRLWKLALLTMLLVGLFNNMTMDILTIRDTVKRTTTSVVLGSNFINPEHGGSSGGAASTTTRRAPTSNPDLPTEGDIRTRSGDEALAPFSPSADILSFSQGSTKGAVNSTWKDDPTIWTNPHDLSFEADAVSTSLDDILNRIYAKHRNGIRDFAYGFAQSFLLQKLGVIFNQTNTTELEADLRLWLSQWSETPEKDSGFDPARWNAVNATTSGARKSHSMFKGRPGGRSWWGQLPFQLLNTFLGRTNRSSAFPSAMDNHPLGGSTNASEVHGEDDPSTGPSPPSLETIPWSGILRLMTLQILPLIEHFVKILVTLGANFLNFTDTIYALILSVLLFRYFTQLEYSLLYYAILKVLVVVQPERCEARARRIEREITVSFTTLLESFWHLIWYHFAITFTMFKYWGLPTPFFCGLLAVLLVLFPLTPKWLNPCLIALVVLTAQALADGGMVGVLGDRRVLGFFAAVVVDYRDDWLLQVTKGPRRDPLSGKLHYESKHLPPFVVGTMVVLGFVAYGAVGILLGPLTAIIAKVFFDNWDLELMNSPSLRGSVLDEPTSPAQEKDR